MEEVGVPVPWLALAIFVLIALGLELASRR